MQEIVGIGMLRKIGDHGPDNREVVGTCTHVRKKFAHFYAGLTIAPKLPRALHDSTNIVELRGIDGELVVRVLSVFSCQAGLGVEAVHLGDAAVHIEEYDASRLRHPVRYVRQQWTGIRG